jgi:hypothetical protein
MTSTNGGAVIDGGKTLHPTSHREPAALPGVTTAPTTLPFPNFRVIAQAQGLAPISMHSNLPPNRGVKLVRADSVT